MWTRVIPLEKGLGLAVALAFAGAAASAQVPGIPVLQNAFGSPGLAFAMNVGGGGGQSFFGLAGALGMGSGRLQFSGAAGVQRANQSTRGAYGARGSAMLWTSSGGGLGAAAFAGIGGAPRTRIGALVTNPAALVAPVGLSVGYRRAIGATRGISAYLSPHYRWTRSTASAVTSTGVVRVSGGLDFAWSPSLGVTVGGDFGQNTTVAPSLIGAAITFVPGRR